MVVPSAIATTNEQQQSGVSILTSDVTHIGVSIRSMDYDLPMGFVTGNEKEEPT
jgi:hypothetical protein